MATLKVQADALIEGDYIPGLDNGYVVEVDENDGYLSYPRVGSGMSAALPMDTILVTYHDANGEECYLMLPSESMLTIERN
jgi:hypothetical protein